MFAEPGYEALNPLLDGDGRVVAQHPPRLGDVGVRLPHVAQLLGKHLHLCVDAHALTDQRDEPREPDGLALAKIDDDLGYVVGQRAAQVYALWPGLAEGSEAVQPRQPVVASRQSTN